MAYSPERRQEITSTICTQLALGKSLESILSSVDGMPTRQTIYGWLHEDAAFFDNYTRAREAQADYFADEVVSIADTEPDAQKAKNKIDARKWAAGVLKPKSYGNKIDVSGSIGITLDDAQLESRIAHYHRKAGAALAAGGAGETEEAS